MRWIEQAVWQVVIVGRSASSFAFAYPATRKSANITAIKTTTNAVATASRLANKRRIAAS
jgi:hypothetical protein